MRGVMMYYANTKAKSKEHVQVLQTHSHSYFSNIEALTQMTIKQLKLEPWVCVHFAVQHSAHAQQERSLKILNTPHK